MTPEEKAKELYDKMYSNCTMTLSGAASIWPPLVTRQCLICVDEILESRPADGNIYWLQVKEALQKL